MKKLCIVIGFILAAGCAPLPPEKPVAKFDIEQNIDGQMDSLAKQIVYRLKRRRAHRIALKGFVDLGGETGDLEKYLEMELTDRLHRTGYFTIIEKETLEKYDEAKTEELVEEAVSEELKIEREDVKKIGRALMVDSILVGTTVDMGSAVKVSVKLISTRTGAIFGTASLLLRKDSTVRGLMDEGDLGVVKDPSGGGRYGVSIEVVENQYRDLIPDKFVLYLKHVNFEMDLLAETESNVEVFLNDELKVLELNEMLSFTYDEEKYVLTLRKIARRAAVFTFARLKSGGS